MSFERFFAELALELGPSRVTDELAVREAQSADESGLDPIVPRAVVFAESVVDVQKALRAASKHRVKVTPRAAATGKAGGAIPDEDGIALVLTKLSGTLDVHEGDMVATADAGVVTQSLHDAARATGLFFGPDPNSLTSCTLGGNVAVNAGGPSTFKYGSTGDWLLGVDVVLADGSAHHFGRGTHKGVGGYDFTSLMCGSEGTLGVITRATFRLIPACESTVTVLALIKSLERVSEILLLVQRAGLRPRAFEMLDRKTLSIARRKGVPVVDGAEAALMIELDGSAASTAADLEVLGNILEPLAVDIRVASSASERARLWEARKQMSWALKAEAKHKLSEDVVVPPSKLTELFAAIENISRLHAIEMPAYGHAGNGNLHVNFLFDSLAQRPSVERAMAELFRAAVALGGGVSGEHGIGRLKAQYLGLAQNPDVLASQRALKAQLDPHSILNPGKVL